MVSKERARDEEWSMNERTPVKSTSPEVVFSHSAKAESTFYREMIAFGKNSREINRGEGGVE